MRSVAFIALIASAECAAAPRGLLASCWRLKSDLGRASPGLSQSRQYRDECLSREIIASNVG